MCHAKSECKAPAYAKSCTSSVFTYSLVSLFIAIGKHVQIKIKQNKDK